MTMGAGCEVERPSINLHIQAMHATFSTGGRSFMHAQPTTARRDRYDRESPIHHII
uniref:Uncharacterized protein n=1 Tax=Picea sitchensis TaxID=3332 RepID=A0A6B9XQM6_PICSI|nr:hypothetical protein Q903MT_gene3901 [Picea sitchensis]